MVIIIIGGGAAGFFAALAAKSANPDAKVVLLERSLKLLSKVRISGGGRCNVTHACFEPNQLIENYPRGKKELLGPFHQFQPQDTIEWFKKRGVRLKTEKDGRMFPITDSSETIINCFMKEAKKIGVVIKTQSKVQSIEKVEEGFQLKFDAVNSIYADRLILATGSGTRGWEFVKNLGHTLQPPVPSLFTFNVPSFPLVDLSGVSVPSAKLKLEGSKLEQEGPLLITHWGFSGPAALKLSAFAARFLAEKKYNVTLLIDWLPHLSEDELRTTFEGNRQKPQNPTLPKSLWKTFCPEPPLSNASIKQLCNTLKRDLYLVQGKTTNKEEFVTCGGVTLSEVQFKTMESKLCKNLYFCGEILDIDGITGGFNFQNAWTTGWISGNAAASL